MSAGLQYPLLLSEQLLQVTLGAQACSQSGWLPGLSRGPGKFAVLVLFTHSSVDSDQGWTDDVDTAHNETELSQASSIGGCHLPPLSLPSGPAPLFQGPLPCQVCPIPCLCDILLFLCSKAVG